MQKRDAALPHIAPLCELGWFCESTAASLRRLLSAMQQHLAEMKGT